MDTVEIKSNLFQVFLFRVRGELIRSRASRPNYTGGEERVDGNLSDLWL